MAKDIYLKLDPIKGEAKDEKHPDTIKLDSVSFGSHNSGTFGGTGGGGSGVVTLQDVQLSAVISKASPMLFKACATGQHIDKAEIFVRKAGGDQEDFIIVTLEPCLVSSYSVSESGGDGLPTDHFSLSYDKITYDYKPQDAKGKTGGSTKVSFEKSTSAKT
jgi:type VI secretion system secreted protein Hcp